VLRALTFDSQSGDLSKFPSSTDLVFGKDTVTETHASNPRSTLLASDLAYVDHQLTVCSSHF
jgi:hypothetical protein